MNLGERILSYFGFHRPQDVSVVSRIAGCDSPSFTIRLDSMSDLRDAYSKCSPVSTIINRLASSMANGQWWILDEDGNDVKKQHKKVWDLINNPNPLQTRTELIKQADIYRNLYGITYLFAVVPSGFTSVSEASSLWALNPERVKPIYKRNVIPYYTSTINDFIERYEITIAGQVIYVDPSHILVIRDSYGDISSFDDDRIKSRIGGLNYEIRNIIQAQEAIFSLNKDRGAQGIITNKTKDSSGSVPLSPDEKKQIQDDYQRRYGLSSNQAKVIITDSDLSWQQMSFNVKDLMLFEGVKENIERISDSLNYPFELLANQKGTTYANRSEAIKYLYQDNIIPASNLYEEKLTPFLGLENAVIEIDFSHIAYLKEDETKQAEARLRRSQSLVIDFKAGIITAEEYRTAQDMDEKAQGATYYEQPNGKEKESVN